MRLISLSSFLFVVLLISCDTASNVEPIYESYYTKYYGEDGEQEGVGIVHNTDGSMILLGNSFSQTDPVSPFIVKTDAVGNVLWQRTFKTDNETAVDIELINGNQLAVLSNIQTTTTNISNVCLYILGQDGNLVDSLYLQEPVNQISKSVSQTSDGGFLVTGYQDPDPTRNPGLPPTKSDQADIMLLKIDNGLNAATDLSPGGGEYSGSGVGTFEVSFSNVPYYLLFGSSDQLRPTSSNEYKQCFHLFTTTTQGTYTGLHGVSGNDLDEQEASTVLKIPPALGDGYLVVGTNISNGSSDLYLTRFNKLESPDKVTKPSLDRIIPLTRTIEGISAANASPDGYFIVANEVRENNKRDIFLLQIERDGAVVWTNSFGSLEGEDTAGGVEALPDGRIAVVGTIQLETQRKMVLIVTSTNGRFSD